MESESQTDGFPLNRNASNSGSHEEQLPESDTDQLGYYDMTKNKILLIFNQENFHIDTSFLGRRQQIPSRVGTNYDKNSLVKVFSHLKFNVTVYKDLTKNEIMTVINNFVEFDHSNTSCVVIAILTHGSKDGVLYAYDSTYNMSDVMTAFENKNLLQIPKVFLVQACRGKKSDAGHYVEYDGEKARYKIPTYGDILVLYSTMEGFVSYRETRGSWMIQTLCEVIQNHHADMDILHIITLMNKKLSKLASYSLDPEVNDKKQTAETRYTLTKLLKF